MLSAMRSGLLLLIVGWAPAFGQAPQHESPSGVIRITVNLVQVDAVVTDSKGRQVTNLKPSDFEILEDGRPQGITNFSYVFTASPVGEARPALAAPAVTPAVPPALLRPQDVRRTMALVVDDLGLSFESTVYVRRALKEFVDQQMRPGDLVAILRTSSGLGALQQFTDSKELLDAAIDRVRWYPMGRARISAFAPMEADLNRFMNSGPVPSHGSFNSSDVFRSYYEPWQAIYTVGTLGAISYIVKGVRDLPGRKSVLVLSDGFQIHLEGDSDRRVLDSLHDLIDLADRSSVVIYAIDARGLQTLGLTAADVTEGRSAADLEQALASRRRGYFGSQAGMAYLAQQTGGFLVNDTNDLNWGVKRVLEDQSGYYLIAYKPSADDFRPGKVGSQFHKLQVSVKVAGLHVRSRSGFYGIPDEETRPVYHTRNEQLAAAIGSPFGTAGVRVSLASQFRHEPRGPGARSLLRVDLHVDPRDLSFQDQPDGGKKLTFDAAIITFGEYGAVADAKDGTFTGALSKAGFETLLKDGVDYLIEVPVKKPGAYQLRAAVLDPPSGRVGSASQFIEVPDLRRGRLTMSGIILNAAGRGEKGPAVRRFQPGDRISYGFEVYNAGPDPATNQAQLVGLIRIFHDGRKVAAFQPEALSSKARRDRKIPSIAGGLQLSCSMEPGAYVLEATIADKLAKGKNRVASQWTDFEIAQASPHCGNGGPPQH